MENVAIDLPHDSNVAHFLVILIGLAALGVFIFLTVRALRYGPTVKRKIDELSSSRAKHDLHILYYLRHPAILWIFMSVLLIAGLWVIIKEGFVGVNCTPTCVILEYRIWPDVSVEWTKIKDIELPIRGIRRNVHIEIITNDGKRYWSVVGRWRKTGNAFEQDYKRIIEFQNAMGDSGQIRQDGKAK